MLLKTSCSWTDGDELSLIKDDSEYPEITVYRARSTILSPSSANTKLDVKCEIDVKFAASHLTVVEVRAVSNARNIELYLAQENTTLEYAKTTRGFPLKVDQEEGKRDYHEVIIKDCFGDAAALRLRMLSLRGDKSSCQLHALEFRCKPAHLSFEVVETPKPEHEATDLRIEHLATIGTQMLNAAERRILSRLDQIGSQMNDRLDKALAIQTARLDMIERLVQDHLPSHSSVSEYSSTAPSSTQSP